MPRCYLRAYKSKRIRLCQERVGLDLMKFVTRLVMISYASLLLKPVMPILVDNMAHALWAKQHYQVMHKHGGKNHVHKEMQKIAKEDAGGSSEAKHKVQSDTTPHLAATSPAYSAGKQAHHSLLIYAEYACSYPVTESLPDYPPPRV